VFVIPGKPVLTGFLVVPDGGNQSDIPKLDLSTFTAMYLAIYTSDLGSSATKYLPKPPFAVIFAVPQNREDYRFNFITPPELLTNISAKHWGLQLDREKSPPDGLPFVIINKAIPIE
jgi:hypothetical protein